MTSLNLSNQSVIAEDRFSTAQVIFFFPSWTGDGSETPVGRQGLVTVRFAWNPCAFVMCNIGDTALAQ